MDRDAFLRLYEATRSDLWQYLAHTFNNTGDAHDVFQETYLRMMKAGLEGKSAEHQRHYLFRVASNLIADHYRGAKRELPVAAEPVTRSTAESVAQDQLLEMAMRALRPSERELLWLAHAEEMSHEEIASLTGYKKASIAPLLSNARRAAAESLKRLLRRPSDERR